MPEHAAIGDIRRRLQAQKTALQVIEIRPDISGLDR
jgi:hypothetical protein